MALSSDEGLPSQAHLLPNGMVQSHVLKHGNGDSDLTEINISMPKIEITEVCIFFFYLY